MKIRLLTLVLFCFGVVHSWAHIGSAGVVYEGTAGPYKLLVSIQPPDVIPGTASVSVMIEDPSVSKVMIRPIYYRAGDEGAPPPDEAKALPNEPSRFEGLVWFMESGTSSVQVEVTGAKGTFQAIVPVMAVATAKKEMEPWRGWLLAMLGLLLVGLMATIIGASMGDSQLKPGENLNKKVARKRVTGSVIGAAFCGVILWSGNTWWNSLANDYDEFMYKPYTASSTVEQSADGAGLLTFRIDSTSLKRRWTSYVIPDHGKLMHMFLVREGTLDVFAHLHPVRKDTLTFQSALPKLPAGKYLVFADIVRVNGFAYTIADTVLIPNISSGQGFDQLRDPEDTYLVTNTITKTQASVGNQVISICGAPGVKTKLSDGSSIVWEEKSNVPLQSGKIYPLKFSVLDEEGKPAQLEPYLGMMGHAAVLKDDASVYIHLHPTGTYSSASQQVLVDRIGQSSQKINLPSPQVFRDSIDRVMLRAMALPESERMKLLMPNMQHASDSSSHHSMVSFPYAFPKAGNYRIWVQIKRNGKVLSGAFDAKVE